MENVRKLKGFPKGDVAAIGMRHSDLPSREKPLWECGHDSLRHCSRINCRSVYFAVTHCVGCFQLVEHNWVLEPDHSSPTQASPSGKSLFWLSLSFWPRLSQSCTTTPYQSLLRFPSTRQTCITHSLKILGLLLLPLLHILNHFPINLLPAWFNLGAFFSEANTVF